MSHQTLSPRHEQNGAQAVYNGAEVGQFGQLPPAQSAFPGHPAFEGLPQPAPPPQYRQSMGRPHHPYVPAQNVFNGPVQCGINLFNPHIPTRWQGHSALQMGSAPPVQWPQAMPQVMQQFTPTPQMPLLQQQQHHHHNHQQQQQQQQQQMMNRGQPAPRNFNPPHHGVEVQQPQGQARQQRHRHIRPLQQSKFFLP